MNTLNWIRDIKWIFCDILHLNSFLWWLKGYNVWNVLWYLYAKVSIQELQRNSVSAIEINRKIWSIVLRWYRSGNGTCWMDKIRIIFRLDTHDQWMSDVRSELNEHVSSWGAHSEWVMRSTIETYPCRINCTSIQDDYMVISVIAMV